MNKYLGFDSGNFHFLLDIANVMEVYDALASPEPLSTVLVGDSADVYWRGQRAKMVHLAELLDSPLQESHCYVVCRNTRMAGTLYIVKVDAIHALHEIDENRLSPLHINNSKLNAITDQVYMDMDNDLLVFILRDVKQLFAEV